MQLCTVVGYTETNHVHSSRMTKTNAINTRPEIKEKTTLPNIGYKNELVSGFLDTQVSRNWNHSSGKLVFKLQYM